MMYVKSPHRDSLHLLNEDERVVFVEFRFYLKPFLNLTVVFCFLRP